MPTLRVKNISKGIVALDSSSTNLAPTSERRIVLDTMQIERLRPTLVAFARAGLIDWDVSYGNAEPDGLDAEFITVEDATGGGSSTFTNAVPTSYPVGGIPAGSTFSNVAFSNMFLQLLYGPPPPSPAGEILGTVQFAFNTASPLFIVALLPGDILDIQSVVVETPFDVASDIQLGTVATPGLVFGPGDILPTFAITFENNSKVEIPVPEILRLTINPLGATTGSGFVTYRIRRN